MEKTYRIIFHIDLNAFFASCEMAEDRSLETKPIGIGGRTDRGVLTTANYVARQYGVKSGMSTVEARRLCPQLLLLPVNFDLYRKYSDIFFELLSEYTDIIERGSIDEGYLEMTDYCDDRHPLDIATEIQTRLYDEFHLPVSIGIAPNMFLAKMASDIKKPLGITVLRKRDIEGILWPVPIEEMFGIGKKTYPNLKLLGINTIGDMVAFQDKKKLALVLGNRMEEFLELAKGNDNRAVEPNRYADMKSIGNSSTYATNVYEYQDALEKLAALTKKVVERMEADESVAKTISIQVRYDDFTQINRSKTLEFHTGAYYEIFGIVEMLFDENQSEKPIRLLGVSVSNLIDQSQNFRQLNIFKIPDNVVKEEGIMKLLDSINENYGDKVIKKGVK